MKILAFTILMPAHVYPFIPILRALAERGHEVRLAVCTSRNGQDLPDIGEIPARILLIPPAALPRQQSTRDRFQQMFASHGEPLAFALEEQIRAEAPDLLIVDPMAWGAMVAAEARGLPWVSLSHNPVTIRGTGEDLRGPGIHPRALKGVRGLFFRPLLRRRIQQADHILLPELNRVRSLRGLSPFRTQADLFRTPSLTLATTAEPFEYPRQDWPASLRFVGPSLWEPGTTSAPELDPGDSKPVVLLTDSSVPDERSHNRWWVDEVIDALASEPLTVIATIPARRIDRPLPKNVRIERFIPHSTILPQVQSVVCHGGSGIVHKSLAYGVPVLAIPSAYDRFEVARRLEVSGSGVCLPLAKMTTAEIRRAVTETIGRRAGAQSIADAFARTGGTAAAVQAVETLVATVPPVGALATEGL